MGWMDGGGLGLATVDLADGLCWVRIGDGELGDNGPTVDWVDSGLGLAVGLVDNGGLGGRMSARIGDGGLGRRLTGRTVA